jgi:hypothetical protein
METAAGEFLPNSVGFLSIFGHRFNHHFLNGSSCVETDERPVPAGKDVRGLLRASSS